MKRKFAIIAACLLVFCLGLFVYGKWTEGRRTSVCNGKYVLVDKYYEDWECNLAYMDLYRKCHYVYTDNNGITFEIIAWKEFVPMFDSRDTFLKLPVRYSLYRCNYRDSVVEARKEQIEELNREYEDYIIAGIASRMDTPSGMHSPGLYDYNTIERKGDIPDEEWIVYASEYISRLDEIYSFEEIEAQTPWIESELWADYIELGMCGVKVEYSNVPYHYNNSDGARYFVFSTTEDGRLTPDQVYRALYYGYLLDEKGIPYIPPSEW